MLYDQFKNVVGHIQYPSNNISKNYVHKLIALNYAMKCFLNSSMYLKHYIFILGHDTDDTLNQDILTSTLGKNVLYLFVIIILFHFLYYYKDNIHIFLDNMYKY